jgi:uncharacterized protein YndB with AHSA1/START domain
MAMTATTPSVELEVRIKASPATVFAYLTEPTRIARWMGEAVLFEARPGAGYRIKVAGSHLAGGEIVAVEPNRRLVMTWGWAAPDHPIPPGSSTVEIELMPDGDETVVHLSHRDLPADAVGEHTHGWTHYLDRLAIIAAGGDPGPDAMATVSMREPAAV